jgi:hypothetical protein
MEFTLTYRGPLKSNGKSKHKQEIRRHFHRQLEYLLDRGPLKHLDFAWRNSPDPDKEVEGEKIDLAAHGWLNRHVDGHHFVALVASRYRCLADLDITLLRPDEPGGIVATGGDIDNRLKTLFDALAIPRPGQIKAWLPQENEIPFFCLLEDDSLIGSLRVATATLLEEDVSREEVLCLVRVKTRVVTPNRLNAVFA